MGAIQAIGFKEAQAARDLSSLESRNRLFQLLGGPARACCTCLNGHFAALV